VKASEAIKILEALDPSHEVTLTIGLPKQIKFPQNPMWNTAQPMWVKGAEWPGLGYNEITCKYAH
jgi:hypothetical protein